MKKWLSMAVVAVLALCGFTACGSGGDDAPDVLDPVVETLENYLSDGKLVITVTERTGGYEILFTDDSTLFVPISDTGITAVTEDSNNVYFFVKDGRKITLPKAPEDAIVNTLATLAQGGAEIAKVVDQGGAYEITFADGTKITVTITNTGIVSVSEDAQNVYFTRRDGSQIIIPKQQVTIIAFADPKVKAICIQYWDTDKDGELSVAEAAAVNDEAFMCVPRPYTYNISPFHDQEDLTSFDEFRYFTGMTSIPESAFRWCSSMTDFTMPETITLIDQYAFESCQKLPHINIPASVKTIKYAAFRGLAALKNITLPDGLTTLGEGVFDSCGLTEIVIPESVTSFGNSMFAYCEALKKVTLPSTLTEIPIFTFRECKALESIDIPAGVTQIGRFSFSQCKALTEVTIPAKVTYLGDRVFEECNKLKTIHCKPVTPPDRGVNVFIDVASDCKIYVPAGSVDAYKSAWSQYADLIVAE